MHEVKLSRGPIEVTVASKDELAPLERAEIERVIDYELDFLKETIIPSMIRRTMPYLKVKVKVW